MNLKQYKQRLKIEFKENSMVYKFYLWLKGKPKKKKKSDKLNLMELVELE